MSPTFTGLLKLTYSSAALLFSCLTFCQYIDGLAWDAHLLLANLLGAGKSGRFYDLIKFHFQGRVIDETYYLSRAIAAPFAFETAKDRMTQRLSLC